MFLVLRKSRLSVLAVASIAGLVVFRFVLDSSVRNMPPPVPAATGIPAGPVRVKAVEPGFAENKDMQPAAASAAIATVCGDHPPAVLDYCIQHLGAMQGDIADEALRLRIRALLVKAAGRINQPYAGTALYALAEDASTTPAQDAELRRLTLALCSPAANAIARVAAIQLAGERCYAEALPLLREALAAPRRDAVTDIVRIGSLGLLGDAGDIPLLRRFAAIGPRYATAAETAINRIEERKADDGER